MTPFALQNTSFRYKTPPLLLSSGTPLLLPLSPGYQRAASFLLPLFFRIAWNSLHDHQSTKYKTGTTKSSKGPEINQTKPILNCKNCGNRWSKVMTVLHHYNTMLYGPPQGPHLVNQSQANIEITWPLRTNECRVLDHVTPPPLMCQFSTTWIRRIFHCRVLTFPKIWTVHFLDQSLNLMLDQASIALFATV